MKILVLLGGKIFVGIVLNIVKWFFVLLVSEVEMCKVKIVFNLSCLWCWVLYRNNDFVC